MGPWWMDALWVLLLVVVWVVERHLYPRTIQAPRRVVTFPRPESMGDEEREAWLGGFKRIGGLEVWSPRGLDLPPNTRDRGES